MDLSLLVQYIYYARKRKPIPPAYLHSRERSVSGTLGTRRLSLERGSNAPRYRTLSNVAANVAAVAAFAAQQEEHTRRHSRRPHSTEPQSSAYDDDDESESALARLADSFHSEGGRSARRKQVAWGFDSYPGPGTAGTGRSRQPSRVPAALRMSTPLDEPEAVPRGRPEVRSADLVEDGEEWRTANSQRRDSRVSRKGATMVFMGAWALFGIGALAGNGLPRPNALAERTGRVLDRADVPPAPTYTNAVVDPRIADHILSTQLAGEPTMLEFARSIDSEAALSEQAEPVPPAPSLEFIIGRISAWVCTTLYLTSRLPQIWKNVSRLTLISRPTADR